MSEKTRDSSLISRRKALAAGGSLALGALPGCSAKLNRAEGWPTEAGPEIPHSKLDGFARFSQKAGGMEHTVFVSKNQGPGVLILHELTGLHAPTKALADWLVGQGYRVYLPLLFGPALTRQPVRNVVRICVRNEIWLFARGRSSPLTRWLRSLVRRASNECAGAGIGVIGMCLTGGFVIPLVVDESVIAGVAAQPSLPMLSPSSLGFDKSLLDGRSENDDSSVMTLRFEQDKLSPLAKHLRIQELVCDSTEDCDQYDLVEVPGNGHSTLTADYQLALSRGTDTRARVLALFEEKLKPEYLAALTKAEQAR